VKNSLLRGVEKLVASKKASVQSQNSAIHQAEMRLFKNSMRGAEKAERRAGESTGKSGKVNAGKLFTNERDLLDSALKLDSKSLDHTTSSSSSSSSSSSTSSAKSTNQALHGKVMKASLQQGAKILKPFADLHLHDSDGVHDMAHANSRAIDMMSGGANKVPSILRSLGHEKDLETADHLDRSLAKSRESTVKQATRDEEEAVE